MLLVGDDALRTPRRSVKVLDGVEDSRRTEMKYSGKTTSVAPVQGGLARVRHEVNSVLTSLCSLLHEAMSSLQVLRRCIWTRVR